MTKPLQIVVIGGGPAGLSAAARLLERGGDRVRVKLVHMAKRLGGKAISIERADGSVDEHGWHMVVGFYDNLRALMRRAGVSPSSALASMHEETHCYEPSLGGIYTMSSAGGRIAVASRFSRYEGLPFEDRGNFGRFMAQAFSIAESGEDLTKHDDICFDTWAVERGLRRHITRYSFFRFLRIAYFNFPEQISAYHVLQTLKLTSDSERAELEVARGGMTDFVWDPVGAYVRRLGGEITGEIVARDWIYDGDRIVGVQCAKAKSDDSDLSPRAESDGTCAIEPGSEQRMGGFDYVLSTIPVACLAQMNREDARMWGSPYFARLRNIRSAVTLNLTITTKKRIASQFRGPLHGFPSPLNFVVNMKPYWTTMSKNADIGSVLVFGGQEAGFESWTDRQIIDFTLDNFSARPEIGDIRAAGIVKADLRRNRAAWERLLISEPGIEPFRPGPRTPFRNWFVAGDWVKNSVSVISMEGAVTSGIESADALLERAGVT